jgi:hypothetical protein
VQLAHPATVRAADHRDDLLAKLAIALGHESRDLLRALVVLRGVDHDAQVRRGAGRRLGNLVVVLEVRVIPLEQRVRLVDVQLASEPGRVVAGVLGVVQARDLVLRRADLPQRDHDDQERGGEQQEHCRERPEDAASGRPSGGGRGLHRPTGSRVGGISVDPSIQGALCEPPGRWQMRPVTVPVTDPRMDPARRGR